MIPCVSSFLLGICTLCLFSVLPSFKIIFSIFFILFILSCITKLRKYKIHWVLFYSFGLLLGQIHADRHLQHQLPMEAENIPLSVIGMVVGLPENKEPDPSLGNGKSNLQNTTILFKIEQTMPSYLWTNPGQVRLHLNNLGNSLRPGDRYALTVKLKRPHGYSNPGSFDKERYYFYNRISAEGYVDSKKPITRLTQDDSILTRIHRFRYDIFSSIFKNLHQSSNKGILSALVVGSHEGISPLQWQVFRDTGTAHLVAISGLHIGLIAGFAFFLVRLIYRFLPEFCYRIPVQIVAAFCSIFAALSYAALAGFSVSTQRSVIMVIVLMLCRIWRRQIYIWHSYFLTLFIVLLLDPISILGAGFWLSFSAVAILLYGMQQRIAPKGLWHKWGRAQWVIFLGLIPVSLAIFNQLSWVAPIANLIAIPWVSFTVVPFAILGGIFSTFMPQIGGMFLLLAEGSLRLLWPFLEKSLQLFPKMIWSNIEISTFALGFSLLGIVLLLSPKGFPARKLGIVFMLPLFFNKTPKLDPNTLRFSLLDVGQGLSAVVETANHLLIFDTGPSINENFNTGEKVVLPYLATRGKSKIDAIIISHADNDHVGGLASIVKKLAVENILSSEPMKIQSILKDVRNNIEEQHTFSVQSCRAAQKWHWDGVDFEILHPGMMPFKKKNDHSCVLRIQAGEHSILLTGDIEARAEQYLIDRFSRKLASTILVVPHHGSKTSSSIAFIDAVNPKYAIVSAGYKNRFQHPHPLVVERYRNRGINKEITLLNTIEDGALTFQIKPNQPISFPSRNRVLQQKFWH